MRRTAGITLGEVILLIVILVFTAIFFALTYERPPDRATRGFRQCQSNLGQLGRAIGAYTSHYGDYWPFFESRRPSMEDYIRGTDDFPTNTTNPDSHQYVPYTEQRPMSDGDWSPGVRAWWATDSLTMLYPEFVPTSRIFRCPVAGDRPEIFVEFHDVSISEDSGEVVSRKRVLSHFGLEHQRAKTGPRWSSYGYNNRIGHARVSGGHVVLGDMDYSGAFDSESGTANHEGGSNLLFFDGSVKFVESNFASDNELDDVYYRQSAIGWDDWDAKVKLLLRR